MLCYAYAIYAMLCYATRPGTAKYLKNNEKRKPRKKKKIVKITKVP